MLTSNRGTLVSAALAGSWRSEHHAAPDLSSSQLDEVTPLLYGSGAAALGWWRIQETALRDSPAAELLHQAFRLQTLLARVHENQTGKIAELLRVAGIESIIIKGWAVARHYPQIGLRPAGDIDVVVRPRDYRAAREVVATEAARDCWVDLHQRIFELSDRPLEDLFARSQLVPCSSVELRVLAAEDHLALLAVHLLKHAAWRPLWLCDLGLLLEGSPKNFAWDLCLGRSKRQANWILSAIGLAQALLDARPQNDEIAARARKLPEWLTATVLKQWDVPFNTVYETPPQMAGYLRHPFEFLRELPNRWPNPIAATVNMRGEFNKFPRITYQTLDMAGRMAKFLWRLPRARV